MSTANLNDGLVALKDGRMILLRVPYPLGFSADLDAAPRVAGASRGAAAAYQFRDVDHLRACA
jgi:hypothetical protein